MAHDVHKAVGFATRLPVSHAGPPLFQHVGRKWENMERSKHWYPKYPGDYARDTGSLSMLEHGAYNLLLDSYYSNGPIDTKQCLSNASLMPDRSRVYRLCGAHTKEEMTAVDNVLMYFFTYKDGLYYQKRADEVIEKQRQSYERRAEAGRKGGRSNAKAMLEHSLSNQNQNQILNNSLDCSQNRARGSFKKDLGDGGREPGFAGVYRVEPFLDDNALDNARAQAPGWNLQNLMAIYDSGINDGSREPPKYPKKAFPAWCNSYTKGRRP